ncbi:hypothetical protein T8J41_13355 [Nitratireductor rhodophyticola]|uniref:hypothetical protein n=1 Tax=Nitratireductor rhodophyticola TaxID=2854036 RepID=UPI001FD9EF70|nr:hypothetical protein [Nitratireductor rhodophyticola]MEC9245122.1 hypothetical protein [Pseudomonadota bacterium]WPZ13148.1 hypothetical protein T8J41_13355 [Nitratireductor rhodophyticola]
MRKIHCVPLLIGLILFIISIQCTTEAAEHGHTVNQNQTGITLPGVVMPNGFDEIRSADGTTCRSSMSNGGSYIDTGVIGGNLNDGQGVVSTYGRLVIPLGDRPRRLDCDRLYQLELRRLQLEVKMLERGLDPQSHKHAPGGVDWTESGGWTHSGRK